MRRSDPEVPSHQVQADVAGVDARAHGRVTALAAVLAICLAGYLAVGAVLSRHHEFWSPDSAVRFVQTESLVRAGYRDISIPYPAADLDLEGRFFPAGPWFHFMRAGKHYLSYLPYFPALTGPFYQALGYPGLLVLPGAGGLGAVSVSWLALRKLVPPQASWAAAALGLGTPLLIYSTVFWDHSLTAALASGALGLVAVAMDRPAGPRLAHLMGAGALLGLGHWLRNEMYLLMVAMMLAWCLVAAQRRVAGLLAISAGAGLATAPLWLVNLRLFGRALGWKGQDLVGGRIGDAASALAQRSSPGWIADKLGNAYYQLVSPDFYAFNPGAVAVGLAVSALLLAGAVMLSAGVRRSKRHLVLAGALLVAATALMTASNRTALSGLLPSFPVVVLVLIGAPQKRWEWFLWSVTVLFTGAVVVTGTHGGLQWGPRYLLPIVPALVWLAAGAVDRVRVAAPEVWPSVRLAAATIAGASLLIQAAGIEHVDASMARNRRANEAIRAAPAATVVTSLEWLALGAGPLYFEKRLMYVGTAEDFRVLVERMAERRLPRWSYVPQSGGAFGHLGVERWTERGAWRFRTVRDGLVNGIRVVTYEGTGSP